MFVGQILRLRLPSPIAQALHGVVVADAMARLGHDVELIIPAGSSSGARGDLFDYYGVSRRFAVRRLPDPLVRGMGRVFDVAAAVYGRARAVELCYANDCLRSALYATRLGMRTVFHTHQYPRDPRARAVLDGLLRSPHLARVVTNTAALAALIRQNHHVPCDLRAVHNGVDVEAFGRPDRGEARRALGLDPAARVVCYVGHLYSGRGVELLIEAMRSLPTAVCTIIGGLSGDVEALRARVGALPGNVRLLGLVPHPEVPRHLAAADVLVMPYTSRTTVYGGVDTTAVMNPMKMFEYMAAGRPIVASRLPALQEVLVDDVNALLVEPDSAESLRQGIGRLLADETLSARLGATAQREARARHSWNAHAAAILEGLG